MLLGASAVLILLPREYLAPARNMTQLVALPQYALSRASQGVTKSADVLRGEPVPAARHVEAVRARQAAENENVALRQQVVQLQAMVAELQQLRSRSRFPTEGRLIPARVVGWDAAPGRDSMALLKSRHDEARPGDWVASSLAVQAGTDDGVRNELRVLARETLIGWIEQAAPFTARVALLSDAHSNRKWRVHIAAVGRDDRPPEFVTDRGQPADFALEGIGDGRMRLLDVNARFVDQGLIRVGDVVTTDGHDPKLPLAMVIGEIVELQQVKKQPLLYHAVVRHRCEPRELSQVLIVDIPR